MAANTQFGDLSVIAVGDHENQFLIIGYLIIALMVMVHKQPIFGKIISLYLR